MQNFDVIVIGGGPAGLSAAISARENGAVDVLIIERENELGGDLNQYIHVGFSGAQDNTEFTGPEYAQRLIDRVMELNIRTLLRTEVIDISKERLVTAVNETGIVEIRAEAVVLALGAREKPKGTINIQGRSCAGIFTAGAVQRFINNEGFMPGKHAVVIGSADTGLVAAKSMVLEGGNICAIVESGVYPKGAKRNIEECINELDIPIKLRYKVIDIKGRDRVEGVTIIKLDADNMPIQGTEEFIACDTLILSMGLRPEDELLKKINVIISEHTNGVIVDDNFKTNFHGVLACGNVTYIHSKVDEVIEEAYKAGKNAAEISKGKVFSSEKIILQKGDGIKYIVPEYICLEKYEEASVINIRTDNYYKNYSITLYVNEDKLLQIDNEELIPGETESILLEKTLLRDCSKDDKVVVRLENIEKTGLQ